jgi:hypothetical protein
MRHIGGYPIISLPEIQSDSLLSVDAAIRRLTALAERVAVLLAEARDLQSAGFHFRIVHRFRMPACTGCIPGEEVFGVFLVCRGREYCLRLSLALRILFDYLARHSRFAQSARQIEFGIRADDFYKDHAKNANGRSPLTRRITRSAIRVYIERLRKALRFAFQEAGVNIDPSRVLIVLMVTVCVLL